MEKCRRGRKGELAGVSSAPGQHVTLERLRHRHVPLPVGGHKVGRAVGDVVRIGADGDREGGSAVRGGRRIVWAGWNGVCDGEPCERDESEMHF